MPTRPAEEAADPTTSPSRLGHLATLDERLATLVAGNSSATPRMLRRLARSASNEVQRAVVANPAAPRDVVLALAASHPREFAASVRGAALLADSTARPPRANHLRACLSWPDAPSAWFDRASWHEAPSVRQLAARLRPTLPGDFVARLARDPRVEVRAEVAARRDLPRSWRDALQADPSPAVRAAVALRDDLDDDARMALARDASLAVRAAAARHPQTPSGALVRLAAEGAPEISDALIENPATPPEALATLATQRSESRFVAGSIGRHPRADARVSALLLAQTSVRDRGDVLLSLRVVSPESWSALLDDPERRVRHAIGFHREVPAWVLERLARDHDPLPRSAAAWNPRTPTATLATLVEDPDTHVRVQLAENRAAPERLRHALSTDAHAVVRSAVAKWTRDPVLLRALAADADVAVRADVWGNPATPADVKVALDADPSVKWQRTYG